MNEKMYSLSAMKAKELLEKGEVSSQELTTSCLERIEKVDGTISAYLTVTADKAMSDAKASDARRLKGEKLSVLDGIPYALKDNICTDGIVTSCASKMLKNFTPPYNATAYQRLEDAGTVLLGKLNMDEFAMGSSCENSYFKATRNPFNTECVPGGSSGGSAAAVAAGEAFLTLGSDTGGSIRQPAGFCGVVGLKPSYGAVSRYGLVAFASSLDQIGPLGRSVDDVTEMFNIIAGHDRMDATSITSELKRDKTNIKGSVIGLPKEYFGEGIEQETKDTVMRAARELEKAGATLKEVSIPSTGYSLSAYYIISSAEASSNLARYDGVKYGYRAETDNLDEMYRLTRSNGFGDEVKRRILLGTFVLSSGYYDAYYKRAKLLQRRFAAEFDEVLSGCDALLTPIAPSPAFKVGDRTSDPLKMYAGDSCTVTVNLAGLPALALPAGMSGDGLPIGMQLIGRHGSDFSLLSLGSEYEKLIGGFKFPEGM